MMGQFLGQSLKKCLHFFPLFELGFLYTTTTYFQKMSSIRKLAIQLYYVLYTTLCCKKNTNYTIVFQYFWFFTKNRWSVLHILIFTTNTAKSPLFLSREITLYNIVYTTDGILPNYDCHFDSAAISKNNPPLLAPLPQQFSLSDLSIPPCYI